MTRQKAIKIHRSNRMENLVAVLESEIAEPLGNPLTPEVFVVGTNGLLRYHGGVDDLGPALAQLVAGQAVTKFESKAFGCTIKRKP